ncbi:hypothetical protein MPSEU_001012700 [Mayamaea pseudoterrestris]|nr:hypothetical protein MPSEU_001012700 [Mayamaea pseudoterrestris]
MARVLFFLALVVAAVSAFVSPASHSVASPAFTRSTQAKMVPVEMIDASVSQIAANANLIATSSTDNGGLLFPVVGLGLLAATILFLSPPLAPEE